jgi:tetratricopeptide (TPR) repeat protein
LIKVNNQIKAADLFVYLSGEDLSTTLADFIDANISNDFNSDELPENLRILLKMKNYKKNNDYSSIISLYDSLDGKYKKNKLVQTIYISACKKIDIKSERYKKALENYAAIYPNEKNVPLWMIDLYYLNKEYNKALDAINKVDSLVNGDPILNFYKANIFLIEEDKADAKIYYDSAFQYDPTLPYVAKNVVILHMDSNETDAAKTALNIYKQTEGFNQQIVDDLYLMYPDLKE